MPDRDVPAGNFDPDINVPDAVRIAAAAADAAHKAAYATPDPVAPESNSPETIKLAETPPSPAAGQVVVQDFVPQQPVAPPQQITPPAPQAEPPQQAQEEDWERRYKAMKGRYDHLYNENRQLGGRLTNLEQTLAAVAKSPPPPQQDPTLDQITPEEISDYGEEFLNLVAKQARRTIAPTIEELKKENNQLKQQLGQVGSHVAVDAKVRLENYLDTHLTTWRDLNYNEDFLGWLAQPDPYSGATRHNLLKQAYDRNDSARVLAFFNGFLADEAATAPQTSSATNGAGNGHAPPKVPLEKFAAPGRARTTAQVPVEKPVIRRDQIAGFYAKVAAGDYNGNEAEKQRLENMIFEAQREGRIT